MLNWTLIVTATAFGGALLLWHAVSRTKHASDEMLVKYREMLADSRAQKAEELAEQADDTPAEPNEEEGAPHPEEP